jgi:hypothetical protein
MKLYRAVIENNNDLEGFGRVQVRIQGLHTKNNENSSEFSSVKTSDLPWAEVQGGTSFGLISGVGLSSVLRQGTWVWVVLNNNNPNHPIVTGTIAGKNTKKVVYSSGEGFCDPEGIYPKDDMLDKGDLNPLLDDKYLTLAVLETPSGHVIELDDTEGDERISVKHRTGTTILIDFEGNITVTAVKDHTVTIAENATIEVTGTSDITLTGLTTVNSPVTNWTGNINLVGDLGITGTSTATGDHVSAGISGKGHDHAGDGGTGSGGSTGGPR